ncbi:hypothetical protein [Methyloligella solikamskensis]|uniref:Uncharacterized protein n=1 Tax=Methyloligella solikamskensis TaxID=1177756 RepID=A0ABW3J9T5_9HYPH
MTKKIFLSAMLAAGLMFAGQTGQAEAAMAAPGLTQAPVQTNAVQKAAWRCGPRRCAWVPGYTGRVPMYARRWGPPPRPACVWERGLLGRWKLDCD